MKIGGFGLLIILSIIPLASAIQITEIMYAPTTAQGGSTNEWVELYNPTDSLINLEGWKISELNNGVTSLHALPNLTIQSKEYLVLARDKTKFDNYYSASCSVIDISLGYGLNNDGDNVSLIDSSGLVIVSAYYDGTIGKNNYSMQLSNSAWCEGIPTPGEISTCKEVEEPEIVENSSEETSPPPALVINSSQNNVSLPPEEENADSSDSSDNNATKVKKEATTEKSSIIQEKAETNKSSATSESIEEKKIIYQSKNEEIKNMTAYLLAILLILLIIHAIRIHKV